MKYKVSIGASLGALLLHACASSRPPDTLIEAREAYSQAEHGAALQYDPAALHDAKQSLQNAEAMYDDGADTTKVEDAAYVAMRRSQRAEAEGRTAQLNSQKAEAERLARQNQAKRTEEAQKQLEATRAQLADVEAARKAAEAQADDAMMRLRLSQAVAMTEKPQETVITVAGSLLFRNDESALMPAAYPKLDKVAEALKSQGDRKIEIKGYTDSVGATDYNMDLSKRRADSVADYLASKGVDRSKITTQGLGPTNPVARNDTPTGRAQNRRVEVTVRKLEPK